MKINVAVLFGGRSVEHEISVISASQAMHAFDKTKYNIVPVYISKQGKWYTGDILLDLNSYKNTESLLAGATEVYFIPEYNEGDVFLHKKKKSLFGSDKLDKIDIVCPIMHGTNGEDGSLQGLLELIGLPYTGCNVLASANGMDKITMKMVLNESGIPVIDYLWFTDKQWHNNKDEQLNKIEEKLLYPVIVKPSNLGSSVGISKAFNREELIQAINNAETFATRILIEKMVVDIREINCAVLGSPDQNITSVCEEPVKTGDILSYEDKYMGGGKSSKGMQSLQRKVPADIPSDLEKKVRELASETFRVLSCHGASRIDFINDKATGKLFVNEINTIPGSLSFYLWDATNIPFNTVLDKMIDIALKRHREGALKTVSYSQNIFNLQGGSKGKLGQKR